VGIEHSTVIVYDRGFNTYIAEKLAESAKKVQFYVPILGAYPTLKDDSIGQGLDGVERIDDFEKHKDKADLIVFPGEYDGEMCDRIWKEGGCAFGSGLSAEIEINKILFLETLKKVGLKVIKTYRADGLDDAEEYLKDKKNKWIKTPYLRGDFDTTPFHNMKTFKPWLDLMRVNFGQRGSAEIIMLIQDDFPAVVEGGGDRYCIDGVMTPKGTIGYEEKDSWYVYKVVDKFPKIIDDVDQKIATEFKKLGYRGAYSSEDRINEDGEVRFTDATNRFGSPPGEGICETYTTFAQDVEDVANGKMPKMEHEHDYGAIIIFSSSFNDENEICVDFPKEFKANVKLKNAYKFKGDYYCVPNDSDGFFGAVAAQGDTLEEAVEQANEIAEEVYCLSGKHKEIDIEKARKKISDGERFGINF